MDEVLKIALVPPTPPTEVAEPPAPPPALGDVQGGMTH